MPPKGSTKSSSTTPKALVKTGPRDVSSKNPSNRALNHDLPSTARALILRNSKYGAVGTGEVVLVSKLTGREKLDLLAGVMSLLTRPFSFLHFFFVSVGTEDLTEKASKALSRPFKLAECLGIAESQYNGMINLFFNRDLWCMIMTRPFSILG
jgi:hypothetical protein